MSKDYPQNILFTGAGFTKNFGGFLAEEMWSKIFNKIDGAKYPQIIELLLNDFDYESIYHKIIKGEYTEDEKDVIRKVILKSYRSLDDICINWTFAKDAPYPVNIYEVNSLIQHFSEGANKIGFFFTLNQDLFIERHFDDTKIGLTQPGVHKILNDYKKTSRIQLEDKDFKTLPTYRELDANTDLLNSRFNHSIHYVKLHGSYGWLSSDGSNALVIGKDKEDQIESEPLLSCYLDLFRKVLSNHSCKILIIGYGFRDAHINKELAQAIKNFNLNLFIISPLKPSDFVKNLKSSEYGEILFRGLSGYFPYRLIDIFPSDQSETHARKELYECYFDK